MSRFRFFVLAALVIFLIPAYALFSIVPRETRVLLASLPDTLRRVQWIYVFIAAALFTILVVGRSGWLAFTRRPMRFLQRHLWGLIPIAYGLIEAWYAVKAGLWKRRWIGVDWRLDHVMVALGLLLIYVLVVLALAWRSEDEIKPALGNLAALSIGLIVAGLMLAYGYALIIARDGYLRGHEIRWTYAELDDRYRYRMAANLDQAPFRFTEERPFFTVSTDAAGFRNPPGVSDAPIAVIGDSFIFGFGVSDDELWSTVLAYDLGLPIRNHGVYGYEFWHYNLLAADYLMDDPPALVIYGIYANDLIIGPRDTVEADTWLYQRWMRNWQTPIRFTAHELFDQSPTRSVLAWLTPSRQSVEEPQPVDSARGLVADCDLAWDFERNFQESYLRTEVDTALYLAHAGGYSVVFTLIPDKMLVYATDLLGDCGASTQRTLENERLLYQSLCEYVVLRGARCYHMLADFQAQAYATDEPLFYVRDSHWNPAGHQAYADLVAAYLREEGLVVR